MTEIPPIMLFRMNTPLWLTSPMEAEPSSYINDVFEAEVKIPNKIRQVFEFHEIVYFISRLRKYAEFEIEIMLDEKSYKRRKMNDRN